MATEDEPSRGLGGRVPAILATLLSIGILYLVVRTALASMNPVLATQLPPAERSPLLRLRLYELMAPGGAVSPQLARLAKATAITEPLAFEPYFVQARVAEQRGQMRDAILMMEEARLRRRSFSPTRLALADYYARTGRLAETLGELEVLLRLRPDASAPVMAELAKMIATPNGREVLARALVRDPPWQRDFYNAARANAARPSDALALLNEVRALQPNGEHRMERELFMISLIDAGQVRRARQLWLEMLPKADRPANALLANSGFRGKPVEGPFGWTLSSLDVGSATIEGGDTRQPFLDIDYFGGSNARFADQLLALQPGSYRLRYMFAGDTVATSSSLYWSITCQGGGSELLHSEITRPTSSYRRREERFIVPGADCDGQRLSLIAEAGDVPETVNLRIAGLEIVR